MPDKLTEKVLLTTVPLLAGGGFAAVTYKFVVGSLSAETYLPIVTMLVGVLVMGARVVMGGPSATESRQESQGNIVEHTDGNRGGSAPKASDSDSAQ